MAKLVVRALMLVFLFSTIIACEKEEGTDLTLLSKDSTI